MESELNKKDKLRKGVGEKICLDMKGDTFEKINPSQFISFTFPNPLPKPTNLESDSLYADSLRVGVLDSPQQQNPDPPQLAAMLVPINRENDWLFSTETGHLQLLHNSPGVSRLILIGNPPHSNADYFPSTYIRPIHHDTTAFEEGLTPLLIALSPKSSFVNNNLPQIPFATYDDNVIRSVSVHKCVSSCVGEMLVEDIEIESSEFRRRLRFKRMPNLIQTEIRLIPEIPSDKIGLEKMVFRLDTDSLVHPYLPPMVASLSLIATHLEECGRRPNALCVGVGGGALLSFLQSHFGFEVHGVESDEMVVKVAKEYFGLVESDLLQVFVGDGIELLQKFSADSKFDVIMVDLDASDVGDDLGAPPLEFIKRC